MPQNVSHGAAVRPFPAIEQEPFTRSLRLPRVASALLLHFDAHELHHMYPFVPGYHLRRIRVHAGERDRLVAVDRAARSGCRARSCSSRTGSKPGSTSVTAHAARSARLRAVPPRRVRPRRHRADGVVRVAAVAARSRCRSTAGCDVRGRRAVRREQDAARLRRDGAGGGRLRSRCWPRIAAIRVGSACGRSPLAATRRSARGRASASWPASCRTRSSNASSTSRPAAAPRERACAAMQFVVDRIDSGDRHAARGRASLVPTPWHDVGARAARRSRHPLGRSAS